MTSSSTACSRQTSEVSVKRRTSGFSRCPNSSSDSVSISSMHRLRLAIEDDPASAARPSTFMAATCASRHAEAASNSNGAKSAPEIAASAALRLLSISELSSLIWRCSRNSTLSTSARSSFGIAISGAAAFDGTATDDDDDDEEEEEEDDEDDEEEVAPPPPLPPLPPASEEVSGFFFFFFFSPFVAASVSTLFFFFAAASCGCALADLVSAFSVDARGPAAAILLRLFFCSSASAAWSCAQRSSAMVLMQSPLSPAAQ